MTNRFALFLISIWWGWTILTDFFVVPTVFKTINDFFNAGELGVTLFGKLNSLEAIVGVGLVALNIVGLKQKKISKWSFLLSGLCFLIVSFYFFYLTPKLSYLSVLWQKAEATGTQAISGIVDIQQEHQFYHQLYIKLDSVKLLMLSSLLFLNIFKKRHE
jgi:hypothetical protein